MIACVSYSMYVDIKCRHSPFFPSYSIRFLLSNRRFKETKQTNEKKRERGYIVLTFSYLKIPFFLDSVPLTRQQVKCRRERDTTKIHDFSIPHVHIFSFDASFMCVEWGSDAGRLLVSQCVCFPLFRRQQPLAIHRPPYKSIAYKPHARIR